MAASMKVALVLTLTLFLVDIAALTSKFQDDVTHIKRSNLTAFSQLITGTTTQKLNIYCYEGEPVALSLKTLLKIFSSFSVRIVSSSDKYHIFSGQNASEVRHKYAETMSTWFNGFPWRIETAHFKPFNNSCIGIAGKEQITLQFKFKVIDGWNITYFLLGLLLFFTAKKLSRNILFYYSTGISVGLLASLLILVFILSRFVPKKYGAYAVLVGGWSLALYFIQYMFENVQEVLRSYYQYVLGYFAVASLLSFAILYKRGPPSDDRSLNLIKWTIQFSSLILIYNAIQIPEVSIAVIAMMIGIHNFPECILSGIRTICFDQYMTIWRRRFPPKVRLLTEEEYIRLGDEQTRNALDELRVHCRSPDCNAWKTLSRLGSPSRFAQFVEGDSHITDDELLNYDSEPEPRLPTILDNADESELDFRLNSP